MPRRWLFLGFILLLLMALSGVGAAILYGPETGLFNPLIISILVDAVIIGVAIFAARRIRAGITEAWVPRGMQNALEWLLETKADQLKPAPEQSSVAVVQELEPKKPSKILGLVRRWWPVAVLLFASACFMIMLSSGFLHALGWHTILDDIIGIPVMPTISLPPEPITHTIPILGFPTGLTNTIVATLIADLGLVLLAFFATRKIRAGSPESWVPRGLQNMIEWLIETLYGYADLTLGPRAKKIFWLGATIFLFVLFANWMEMIPGIDAIGWIEKPLEATVSTYHVKTIALPAIGDLGLLVGPEIKPVSAAAAAAAANGTPAAKSAVGVILVPFVRAATTDLNLTLSLALITMVMVQFYGFQSLGIKYLGKFIATERLRKRQWMGLVDVFVGVLEAVSEVSKIISFTFRLFGNVFAGQVLLFVIGFLIPFLVFGSMIFWGLEIFVGMMQAFIFMMLAFVFIAQAATGHGDHSDPAESH
jgi:F-type H+-transporting ATPase subunit a